jgi:hypothetical protein
MFFNHFNIIILNTLKIIITAFSSIENKYIPDSTKKVNWLILSNWLDLNESSLGDWSGKEKHSKRSFVRVNECMNKPIIFAYEGGCEVSSKRGSLIRACAWIGDGGLCGYATLQSDDASVSQTLVHVPLICCFPPRIKIISLFLSKTKRRKKKKTLFRLFDTQHIWERNPIVVFFFIFSRSFVCKCMHVK